MAHDNSLDHMPNLRPSAYLLCGPSLSGKSTVAAKLAKALNAAIVCSDAINTDRGLPFGAEGLPEAVWAETLSIQLAKMRSVAELGQSVIADDTLCYRWLRDRHRQAAQDAGLSPILLLLAPTIETLWARHRQIALSARRPVLSETRFEYHLACFEWPDEDEAAVNVTSAQQLQAFIEAQGRRSLNAV